MLKTAACPVKELMTRDVVTLRADATLKDALELMEENRVGAVPVVDKNGGVVGILSATDLVEIARQLDTDLGDIERLSDVSRLWLLEEIREHRLGEAPIAEMMTDSVATIAPEGSVLMAAREMLRYKVHRLPVIDSKRRVIGIVSMTDVLRWLTADEEEDVE